MKTCSLCERPVRAYCGRCGVGTCVEHIQLHHGHKSPEISVSLRKELEEVLAGIADQLPAPPPTLYAADPYCGSCFGHGSVQVYSLGRTFDVPCACRYVAR